MVLASYGYEYLDFVPSELMNESGRQNMAEKPKLPDVGGASSVGVPQTSVSVEQRKTHNRQNIYRDLRQIHLNAARQYEKLAELEGLEEIKRVEPR